MGYGVTITVFCRLRDAAPRIAPKVRNGCRFWLHTPMQFQNAAIRSATALLLYPDADRNRPTRVRGEDHAGVGAGDGWLVCSRPRNDPVERTTFAPSDPSDIR